MTPDAPEAVFIPFGDYSQVANELATGPDLARDGRRMLLFGLLRPYKGIEQLVDAFTALHLSDKTFRLAIMGRPVDPAYGREVETRLQSTGSDVEFRAELLEYEELVAEIRRSAFVVLPYRRMYNSGAALLALSCGTPILVPTSATMNDLMEESGPEWVQTYDGDLTPEILRAASQSFESTASRRDGRNALPRRSWSAVGAAYGRLYRQITRGPSDQEDGSSSDRTR